MCDKKCVLHKDMLHVKAVLLCVCACVRECVHEQKSEMNSNKIVMSCEITQVGHPFSTALLAQHTKTTI